MYRLWVSVTVIAVLILFIACSDDPVGPQDTSFQNDVKPIFQNHGCLGCHGGQNDLYLDTVDQILEGGQNGPAVIPFDAEGSLLIQKMSPNPPFGDQMPLGGNPVPEQQIQVIKNWINEGAQDN